MVGLQGSGKTTTTAKIALRLKTRDRKKGLVASLDTRRPAAQEQLQVLADQAGVASLPILSGQGPLEIARRARGTPRVALRLLKRVRDYAQVRADGHITKQAADEAMDMLRVDPQGFDEVDRRMLRMIIENFEGGPVGVESLAAALSEERGTLEDVIEPYLIQQGYLVRSARGRMATAKAYLHLGLTPPRRPDSQPPDLFA